MITYKIKTAPAAEPVPVSDVADFLRYSSAEQTDVIQSLMDSALMEVEKQSYRRLVTQTWTITCDTWQEVTEVIKYGRLQSITSIKYLDEDEASQTVSTDDYRVAGTGGADKGHIIFYSDGDFDYPSTFEVEPITIEFICGYGLACDVPEVFKMAIKMLVSDMWAGTCYGEYVQGQMYQNRVWDFF
jgi:uncharacterized phiE125 gp8 family phage protein